MEQNQPIQSRMTGNRMVVPIMADIPFQVREAINVLRGNIQLSGYNMKVVAITSALAHEGKSSIAFRLAKSLAGLQKRTLYLDCDIRNSMTITRYDIQQRPDGLSEFLCGAVPLTDIICRTDDPWMDMIFTGAIAPNPSELVSGTLFRQMIAYLKDAYDYVIVDAPPINPVIDGTIIAKECDGTLLVVESGVTDRMQAIRAKRQLEYAGVKIIGSVLNKIGTKKSGYGYGYGHYGYGYGENAQIKAGKSRSKKKVKRKKGH